MTFMYADLEEVLNVIRPLTAKHGLAFAFEGEGEKMVCSLYHSSHGWEEAGTAIVKTTHPDGRIEENTTPLFREVGVLRTLAIEVARKGEKKAVGIDSTYARKYMLAEVLGLAPDDDMDADMKEATAKQARNSVERSFLVGIENANDIETIEKRIELIKSEIYVADLVEKGFMPKEGVDVRNGNGDMVKRKLPLHGLKADQYRDLLKIAEEKKAKIEAKVGTDETSPEDGIDASKDPLQLGEK